MSQNVGGQRVYYCTVLVHLWEQNPQSRLSRATQIHTDAQKPFPAQRRDKARSEAQGPRELALEGLLHTQAALHKRVIIT